MTTPDTKPNQPRNPNAVFVPLDGHKYRHYKGGFYVVLCTAIEEGSLRPVVVYRSYSNPSIVFVRPLHEFMGTTLTEDGQTVYRFILHREEGQA